MGVKMYMGGLALAILIVGIGKWIRGVREMVRIDHMQAYLNGERDRP